LPKEETLLEHLCETARYAQSLLCAKQRNVDCMQKEIGRLLLRGQEKRARLKVYLLSFVVCTITNQKYLNHSHKINIKLNKNNVVISYKK